MDSWSWALYLLIADGKLVFSISNERFTRIKYDGNFSKSIALDILSKFNFTPEDIDILSVV